MLATFPLPDVVIVILASNAFSPLVSSSAEVLTVWFMEGIMSTDAQESWVGDD